MSDNRSPREIEEQIERERAELAGTLNTLQDRYSVEGVMTQVSEHLRTNGSEIARNVSETVKQNPLGVALVGAGIAWLMFGKGPSAKSDVEALPAPRPLPAPAPRADAYAGGYANGSAHTNGTSSSYANGAAHDSRPAS